MKMLDRLLKREPVVVVTVVLVAAITAYKVFVEKVPPAELLTEDYAVYVFGLASALAARFLAVSPATDEKRSADAVQEALSGEYEYVDPFEDDADEVR